MKSFLRFCALLGLSAVLVSAAADARADWPYGSGNCGGYNWGFQRWALLNGEMPPYFAMFPPVYYRLPIEARTYGSSPFAYPPCNCPVAEKPQPAMVINPFVKPPAEAAQQKSASNGRIVPLVVLNPYVTHDPPSTVAADAR